MGDSTNMPVEGNKYYDKAVADAKKPHETVQQREFREQREAEARREQEKKVAAIPNSRTTTAGMTALHRDRQATAAAQNENPPADVYNVER